MPRQGDFSPFQPDYRPKATDLADPSNTPVLSPDKLKILLSNIKDFHQCAQLETILPNYLKSLNLPVNALNDHSFNYYPLPPVDRPVLPFHAKSLPK